jgi:protein-S-isoprenylcysteine O-methyltransferase Ste14
VNPSKDNQLLLNMIPDLFLLSFFWILFCVLHSVLAAPRFKNRMKALMGKSFIFYRPFYIIFAFVTMIAIIIFQVNMNDVQLYLLSTALFLGGIVVCFSGLVLMIVCIEKYFILLSGIPDLFQRNGTSRLMITGIHRYVRHPLYLGTFVFIWGLFVLLPYAGLLITNVIITVYTLIGIKLEESKLVEEFGEDYRLYRKKVPMLLPDFRYR